jgi:hypothetical protein
MLEGLKVKTTHTLTTDDLEIFCDPPLTFESAGSMDPRTVQELREWYKNHCPNEQAVMFVPKIFLSVAQNGKAYPLTTQEDAMALQKAVGDKFISRLVNSYWNYEVGYFEKKQSGSVNSLTESSGNGTKEATP